MPGIMMAMEENSPRQGEPGGEKPLAGRRGPIPGRDTPHTVENSHPAAPATDTRNEGDRGGGLEPEIEPLTLSLLGKFFGVPLLIIGFIVGGAVVVVLLFGAPGSPQPRSIEDILTGIEAHSGERNMGMLLPPGKEYWQTALELAERLEKDALPPEQLAKIAERTGAIVRADLAEIARAAEMAEAPPVHPMKPRLDYLIRALGHTRHPAAVEVLREVVEAGREPYTRVAVMALGNLHDVPEARTATDTIVELLRSTSVNEARLAACTALSVLAAPGDEEVIAALKEARIAGAGEVEWSASLALARLGSDAGRTTLLDLLDRRFWETGDRYQVVDEKGVVRRYAMPPQRVEGLLVAAIDAAAQLDDRDLWDSIDRLQSDASRAVARHAAEVVRQRGSSDN